MSELMHLFYKIKESTTYKQFLRMTAQKLREETKFTEKLSQMTDEDFAKRFRLPRQKRVISLGLGEQVIAQLKKDLTISAERFEEMKKQILQERLERQQFFDSAIKETADKQSEA